MATPLLALATLFAPGDQPLVAALGRAADPWAALIAGLERRKRAIMIDWKTFPSDVLWAIDRLLPKDRTRWAWCDVDRYEDTTRTDRFLAIAGRGLAASGQGLVSIDDESDAYHLAIVPFAQIATAQRLARQTKLGRIDSFAPRTKPSPPPPLPKARPSPPTRRAKQFRVRGGDLVQGKRVHASGMVFTKGDDRGLQRAELVAWPPRIRRLTTTYRQIAFGPAGRFATHTSQYVDDAWVTTLELHDGKRTTTIGVPANLGIADLQFVGDQLVVFPESFSLHLGVATAPLGYAGGRWRPLRGLPRARPPRRKATDTRYDRFVAQGLARTREGRDVILWLERGYERQGATWVPTFELGRCTPSDELATVPVADGFVFVDGERLKHAVRGKKARCVLPKTLRIDGACAGPEGSVVCALIRPTRQAPAAVIYFPDRGEYALVPATAFSLRGDMFLDAIAYSAALDLVVGIYEHDYSDPTMAPVYGASLLALPRKHL